MADVLAQLICDCDARLAALDAEAAQSAKSAKSAKSAADGAPRSARLIHVKSFEVRRELEELHAMQHRLFRRFYGTCGPPAPQDFRTQANGEVPRYLR
jgi:hypothetical protein